MNDGRHLGNIKYEKIFKRKMRKNKELMRKNKKNLMKLMKNEIYWELQSHYLKLEMTYGTVKYL